MASLFFIREGDTLPALSAILVREGPGRQPLNLTAATAIKFIMRPKGATTPTINAAATIVAPEQGRVRYSWLPGDTASAGEFQAEFQVDFSGGGRQTIPTRDFITIVIAGDVGD